MKSMCSALSLHSDRSAPAERGQTTDVLPYGAKDWNELPRQSPIIGAYFTASLPHRHWKLWEKPEHRAPKGLKTEMH